MYSAAAEASKTGPVGGKYLVYGFGTPGSTGAELRHSAERAYNPAVPDAVVAELDGLKKKFAAGELKVTVTREDARGGT
jgi:simple sugar transport system substrate-binding protein/basic membrane protein A